MFRLKIVVLEVLIGLTVVVLEVVIGLTVVVLEEVKGLTVVVFEVVIGCFQMFVWNHAHSTATPIHKSETGIGVVQIIYVHFRIGEIFRHWTTGITKVWHQTVLCTCSVI